jgi:hypothetical protein
MWCRSRSTDAQGSSFVYLEPVGTIYDMRVIKPIEVDPQNSYTLSAEGVTRFCHGLSSFTPLAQFEREFYLYNMVIQVGFRSRLDLLFCCLICYQFVRRVAGCFCCDSYPSSASTGCGRCSWSGNLRFVPVAWRRTAAVCNRNCSCSTPHCGPRCLICTASA